MDNSHLDPINPIISVQDYRGRAVKVGKINGLYFAIVDGKIVQRKLNADAIIRWLGMVIHKET